MNKRSSQSTILIVVLLSACGILPDSGYSSEDYSTVAPVATLTAPSAPVTGQLEPDSPGRITSVWANDGEDKVTRDELRATADANSVGNMVWDGTGISLFGARNEVVSFNLILESSDQEASGVTVSLTELIGPNGASITTREASGNDLFNTVGRNIELFYVRYLEIKGISTDLFFAGYDYDERHIPLRCRRPHDAEGEGQGGWEDRPCHNLFYPEIAVPLELHTPFTVPAGTNQSIWGDITIPQETPAGTYNGIITVMESDTVTWRIPITLQVYAFTLSDLPSARTMVYLSQENINDRYLGIGEITPDHPDYAQSLALTNTHFQIAHRHKLSLIDDYIPIDQLDDAWLARLDGSLFTAEQEYGGVGKGTGNNVYAIGTYGGWPWQEEGREAMWANADQWVQWFEAQAFGTPTEYFLYLIDESDDYRQTERWAGWIEENPGPGQSLLSLATTDLPTATELTPSLDIPASWPTVGMVDDWEELTDLYLNAPDKRVFLYNSNRPLTGSFAIEDEGVALRMLAWSQYAFGIERWFYWESTYYDNFQGDMGPTNVFQQAHTFGGFDEVDSSLGETGWNYLNGDGVLFYPGTDMRFPNESYGVQGPFVSLRMKHWRRGIQDVDYLVLANGIDPERTAQIVESMIPQVLWQVGVTDPDDPTWVLTDISWSIDPDVWESARAELAEIIVAGVSGD